MKYIYNDAGKEYSKRPKQKNDCVVRAYAITTKTPYDDAYDLFKACGRESFKGTEFKIIDKAYKGVSYYCSFSEHYGLPSIAQVLKLLKHGRYIVCLEIHVFAVINGVIHDTYPIEKYVDKPVQGFWIMK